MEEIVEVGEPLTGEEPVASDPAELLPKEFHQTVLDGVPGPEISVSSFRRQRLPLSGALSHPGLSQSRAGTDQSDRPDLNDFIL